MQKYLSILSQAWRLLSEFHTRFYIQLVLIFTISAVSVGLTFLEGKIFNYISDRDLQGLLVIMVSVFVINLFETLLNFLKNYNEEKYLNHDIGQFLQKTSLERILKLTSEQHIDDHSAIKQQIITRGENAVETLIKVFISDFFPNFAYVVIATVSLFFYSALIGTISTVFLLVLFLWMSWFLKFYKPIVKRNRDNWIEQGKIRTEAFTHLPMIKSLGRESYFIKKYLDKRKEFAEFAKHTNLISIYHRGKKSLYADLTQNSTLILAGILAVTGYFTLGTVYVIWSITNRAFWSISSLSNAMRDLPLRYAEAEQYFDAIDMTPSFEERGRADVPLNKDIIFNAVSFQYKKSSQPIFSNLSFTIPSNKITAFVGHSGSGKSTLTKLLLRSYAYNIGSIKIGDAELRDIDAKYLREHVGYVEQHVDLLDDTIKENILIAAKDEQRSEASEKLDEVAKLSRITEFYDRLGEKRFDTVVGERGIKLSGGERQRVGIARAIIKNPEILIFDEATSSLDSENEKYVMEAIKDVSKGKTTIIIAHRLSTVRDADKIIVMDKGSVVGQGTHAELMQNSPMYKNLVDHQIIN